MSVHDFRNPTAERLENSIRRFGDNLKHSMKNPVVSISKNGVVWKWSRILGISDRRNTSLNSSHPCLAPLNPTRMQPTRESAIGNDFRDADFRIAKGYQCGVGKWRAFRKLVIE